MDDYLRVRQAVQIAGLGKRAAARRFGIDPRTMIKLMTYSGAQGFVRTKPPVRPKLGPFVAIIVNTSRIIIDMLPMSKPSFRERTPSP